MKKFFKIVLVSFVGLILLIGIAGYVILKMVDLNQYKGLIEEKVTAATGRELKIGNIAIKASFSPTVELQNVSFANAPWSKNKEMAHIGAIDVGVALFPLIHGSYVVNKFIIANALINLEENPNGEPNWVFEATQSNTLPVKGEKAAFDFSLIAEAHAEEVIPVAQDNTMDILKKLIIRRIVLDNVKINYTDKTAKTQSYDIKNVVLDENKDGNIDFDFNVNDGLYSGKGTVGALKLLDAEAGYPVKADVNVMGINVVADATLFEVLKSLRFDGRVKAKGFLGKGSSYDESIDVSAKVDLKKINAVLYSVKIADNVITGKVNANLENKVPAITATLQSDKIDIASFAPKEIKSTWQISLIAEAQATTMVPADKIPYEVLSLVNADADINVAQIVNKKAVIAENMVANIKVSNGEAVLKIISGTLAGGDVKANAALSASTKSLGVTTDMIKVNLLQLLQALGAQSDAFNFVNGSATDLYVKLNGNGNTYASVVESLKGQVSLIIDKSELHLGNIGMIKGNIISQLFNTLNLTKGNDNLNMNCAVVRADFNDGKANFPNGIVINADKFTVVANGDINLKNDKISFGVKPFGGKITDTNIAKALSSLVKLTGTLQKPSIGVDTANVVKNVVGATMTGPVYLGAQMVMEADSSPCYTALKGTGFETRFPKSNNVAKSTSGDVGRVLDGSVDMVKDTAKGLLNMLSGKSGKQTKAPDAQ